MNAWLWSFSISTPQALTKMFLPPLLFPAVWKLHHWKCCSDSAHVYCLLKATLTTRRSNNFPILIKPEVLGHNKIYTKIKEESRAGSKVTPNTCSSQMKPFSLLNLVPDAAEATWLRFHFVRTVPEAFGAGTRVPFGPTTLRHASSVDCTS